MRSSDANGRGLGGVGESSGLMKVMRLVSEKAGVAGVSVGGSGVAVAVAVCARMLNEEWLGF